MNRILTSLCIVIAAATGAAAQADADERALIKLEDAMRVAAVEGDKAVFEKILAPTYFETTSNGDVKSREDALDLTPPPASMKASFVNTEYRFEHFGDVIIENFKGTFHLEINGKPADQIARLTHIWGKTKDGWKLLAEHNSQIIPDPPIATVDPRIYDAYVGDYAFSPERHLLVTRTVDTLMIRYSTDKDPSAVFPLDDHTFFIRGSRSRYIFEKDAKGNVTGIIRRAPDGQEYKAPKMK